LLFVVSIENFGAELFVLRVKLLSSGMYDDDI